MTDDARPRRRFESVLALVSDMARTSPRNVALSAALLLVLTFTEGAGLLLLAPLLALVGVMEDNPLPRAAGWLETGFGIVGIAPTLGSVLLLFVAIAALRTVVQRWQAAVLAQVREELTAAHRIRIYSAMTSAEWRFLVTRTPSEFAHALTAEVGRVGLAVTQLTELSVAIMVSAVYLGLALRLSPSMAMLVLGCAAALAWFVRGTLDRARDAGARATQSRSQLHLAISEHVASMKTARSYGTVERHVGEFATLARVSRDLGIEVSAGDADLQQRLELGSTILLALIVYASSAILQVAPALLLVLIFIFARLMPRLVSIYRLTQGLTMALPVYEAVQRLEAECVNAAEPPANRPKELPLTRAIRFENVSFSYLRRGDAPAVAGLDLRIAAGVTTAIVGSSGSGKSTMADLLTGLLSPTTGRILIDDEPLDADGLASWRRQISYVPQDTFLFHDTVRANLLWSRPGATDQDMGEALHLAAADRFVEALPQGLETIVGERGVLLSGGERQRLSIARALLRRPRVLLLDEATSSLDRENELRIQQAVDGLRHRMTIVIIAHRISTIRQADVIHVMDGGRLVQTGSWESLLADRGGRFRMLAEQTDAGLLPELA